MRPIQPSAFSYLLPQLVQGQSATLPTSGTTNPMQGNGGFSLQVPDGTVTGGNPRGLGAVDLQMVRTAATQVASGAQSFAAGIVNRASGAQSFAIGDSNTASGITAVAIGDRNTASGNDSVAMGSLNTASGIESVAMGDTNTASSSGAVAIGVINTASGGSAVAMGSGCVASGSNSFAVGQSNTANATVSGVFAGSYGTTRSIQGNTVFAASNAPIASAAGAQQTARLVMGRQTTDATPTVLTSNTSAAGTTNQVILANNSAYFFKGQVIANVTGAGDTKGWVIEGVMKRGANAASTTLVGAVTVTSSYADAGASTWAVAVTADTTNGGIKVEVTGQAATTIRWVCSIDTTEVTF